MVKIIERRTVHVGAFVTERERLMLERASTRRGWSTSNYLRAGMLLACAIDGEREAWKLLADNFVESAQDALAARKGKEVARA